MCEQEDATFIGTIVPKRRTIDEQIDDFDAIGIE
jgi:hypothetical protein